VSLLMLVEMPEDLARKLDDTFHLFNANPLKKVAATLFRLDDPFAHGLWLLSSEPDPYEPGINEDEYACPLGGTWTVTISGGEHEFRDVKATNCRIGPVTISGGGQLSRFLHRDGVTYRRVALFSSAVLLDSRDNSSIRLGYSYSAYDEEESSGTVRGDAIVVSGDSENYEAESFDLSRTTGDPNAIDLLSENFSGTLAGAARVRSREDFLLGTNGYPASGALSIIQLGTNRESYDINAGNGNPDTFNFTANIAGVITTYEVRWTSTRNIGDLSLSAIDVGF